MSFKTLMGKWRGGPSDNAITITQLPNSQAQAKFQVGKTKEGKPEFALMTGNFSRHRDIIRGTFFCPPTYPMQNERKQKFKMTLGADRDSWDCTVSTDDGSRETWSAKRAAPERKKGEKLSTKGVAFGSADRFDQLVRPKDKTQWAEEQRRKLLLESMQAAAVAPVDSEPPSVGVGDPFDEHGVERLQKGSRHYGSQMKTSTKVRAMEQDPIGVTKHLDDPFLDRYEVARKLHKEQKEKVRLSEALRSRGTFRPSSAAAYKEMRPVPTLQEPRLDGTVGGPLFLAAKERLQEEANARRARARRMRDAVKGGNAEDKPPPFVTLVSKKPLEYGRYPALTESAIRELRGGAGAPQSGSQTARGRMQGTGPRPGSARRRRAGKEESGGRAPFKTGYKRPTGQEHYPGMTLSSVLGEEAARKAAADARNSPRVSPRRRGGAGAAAASGEQEGKDGGRPAWCGQVGGKSKGAPVGAFYPHLPDPEPERLLRSARVRRGADAGSQQQPQEEEKRPFLPHRTMARSRFVRTVALNRMNLMYRG